MADLWMDKDIALSEVPVNISPLLDDTDFKTREETVAYNAAGLELIWHFTDTDGNTTATVVTPTTGGDYDWAHQDGGMYTIEIPASGGVSINNDSSGFGWFSGVATGVVPWRGPVIGFRPANINDMFMGVVLADSYSSDGTRPTLNQAILEIRQFLMERSVSSTTLTVNKEDGSTAAMTFTFNDANNPSSITRAS